MTPEDFLLPDFANFEPLERPEELLLWLEWRFGFRPEDFSDYAFWQKISGKGIFIAHNQAEPIHCGRLGGFGLMVMRRRPPRGKPTSIFFQRFGHLAVRNCVALSDHELDDYIRGVPIPRDAHEDLSRGDCIVSVAGQVLGCGRFEDNLVRNQWPKYYGLECEKMGGFQWSHSDD